MREAQLAADVSAVSDCKPDPLVTSSPGFCENGLYIIKNTKSAIISNTGIAINSILFIFFMAASVVLFFDYIIISDL